MTNKDKIIALINEFKFNTRDDGTTFYSLNDLDSDLGALIRELHEDYLPDDFIFNKVHSLLVCLGAGDTETIDSMQDEMWSHADSMTDIYTKDLIDWSQKWSHKLDECHEELGLGEFQGLSRLLMAGQCFHLAQIGSSLIHFISEIEGVTND